jgi:flagellar basal body-associated protein FliL
MTKRTFLLVAAIMLLVGGSALYYWTVARPRAAAAADCADKPKPKNEFAMAAECDAAGEKSAGDRAKPSAPPDK